MGKDLKEYEKLAAEIFFTPERDVSPLLEIGMNINSAKGTMRCYEQLINGKLFSRSIQHNVIIALFEKLFKDQNFDVIPNVIKSLEENFEIRLEKYNDSKIGARRIVNEYKNKWLLLSGENELIIPNEITKESEGPIQVVKKQQVTQHISMKLLEKDMEDLIIENPQKYLDEPGLKLISRQYSIGNYRFDLLFEDRHGGKLIVEIQRGTLDRNHTYKILDYYDEYKSKNPSDFVELMLVANKIKRERRSRLKSHGISFKEIPEAIFLEDFRPKEISEQIAIENTGTRQEAINIFHKFLDVLNGHEGKIFSRSEIINLICLRFPGTNQTSLIPSDYCYNLINKGISFQNHIFEQTELGKYKYLGEHYPYTGKVYWSKKHNPVGEWLNGVLIDNPVQNLIIKHPLLDAIREQQPHAQYLEFIDTAEKVEFVEKIHLILCKLDHNIERIFNKKEITYTNGTKFGCVVPQKNKIVVGPLLVKFTEIQDPQKLCRDIRDKTYASGGEIRADFREPYSEAEYAVFLLKQSLIRV